MAQGRGEVYATLARMLGAGLPVSRALPLAARGSRTRVARALPAIRARIEEGASFAEAMDDAGGTFRPLEIALVRVGERSGRLAESLRNLSEWYAFLGEIRRLLIAQLVYPILLLHLIPLVLNLPPLVLGEIGLVTYLLRAGSFLAGLYLTIGAGWLLIRIRRCIRILALVTDGALLALPVIGPAVRDLALSRFCRCFAAMIEAGVPVEESLRMSARASGNAVMQDRLSDALEAVREGNPVSEGFGRLPADFRAVWESGETTGGLGEAAARLAEERAESARFRLRIGAVMLAQGLYIGILLLGAWMVIRMAMKVFGQVQDLGVLP